MPLITKQLPAREGERGFFHALADYVADDVRPLDARVISIYSSEVMYFFIQRSEIGIQGHWS